MNEIIIRRINYMDNPQDVKFMYKPDISCWDEVCEFEILVDGKEIDGLLGISLDMSVFDRNPIVNIKTVALTDGDHAMLERDRKDFIKSMNEIGE